MVVKGLRACLVAWASEERGRMGGILRLNNLEGVAEVERMFARVAISML